MRNRKSGLPRIFTSLALTGVMALGVAVLTTDATARPPRPGPLCGPTILFECTFRDGSTELVGLTVCEVAKYEKKNKATCEPATF